MTSGAPVKKLAVGSESGRPKGHLFRQLKRRANRAGPNRGVCAGCKSVVKEFRGWKLQKLRRIFATTLPQEGADQRTVQQLMEQADLASTMWYLQPASASETLSRINAIKWH
jgi:Phage integrase family